MAGVAAKLETVSLPDRPIYIDGGTHASGFKKSVTVDSTTVDSANSPTTLLRPGLVVGIGTGNVFYDASDSASTKGLPATHTGSGTTFPASSAFVFALQGGANITITGASSDNTVAEYVTLLNANEQFNSTLIAVASGSNIKISSVLNGPLAQFTIVSAPSGWGLTAATYTGSAGEYGVLEDYVDMLDGSGVASDMINVTIAQRGRFDESQLLDLTDDARTFLLSRGSTFE